MTAAISPLGSPKGTVTRRTFLAGSGALVLSFSGLGRMARAQSLPGNLRNNQELDSWIRIDADGNVTVFTGKVELGQGIKTALAQIAADELDVSLERIRMITADTGLTPNEGYTAGSGSVTGSGTAIRYASAEVRQILLELAATRLGIPAAELEVDDGAVSAPGSTATVRYEQLVEGGTLHRAATGNIEPKSPRSYRYVGRGVPRLDIPAKVFGEESYVQDLRLPGMLHGRVVRPPSYDARLEPLDPAPVDDLPGVVKVVRDGSFLAVVAEREEQALAAAEKLAHLAKWQGGTELPPADGMDAWLRAAPSEETVLSETGQPPGEGSGRLVEARYSKPYIAHASVGPSCAVAQEADGVITVYTHSQGVFPLRSALSQVLDLPEEKLHVIHREGAGCYGHNGADDAACDAALLARAVPGKPVRVQWSREDEHRWEPFGSAMCIDLKGSVDEEGRINWWQSDLYSTPASTRPGRQANFLAAWHRANPLPAPRPWSGGVDRNALPLYELPNQRVVKHFVPDMPLRVSALRGLGAYGNIFALESFVDELAAAAGADPVEFRLRHLKDERARAVIEAVARCARWNEAPSEKSDGKEKRGRGIGFARYKNSAAYVAVVARVAVDGTGRIRVEHLFAAVDAGQAVNPDGLRNQIEGGMVQSVSWTTTEQVSFDRQRVTSVDWSTYPILTFPEAPQVDVLVLDRPEEPPLGAGEAAQGPTAAAVANALFDATGSRVRDLPLSRS